MNYLVFKLPSHFYFRKLDVRFCKGNAGLIKLITVNSSTLEELNIQTYPVDFSSLNVDMPHLKILKLNETTFEGSVNLFTRAPNLVSYQSFDKFLDLMEFECAMHRVPLNFSRLKLFVIDEVTLVNARTFIERSGRGGFKVRKGVN